jgi:predicted transcriptional regulator
MEKLTYQEEEAMRFIWYLGPCFVKDVVGCYAEPKPPYTTVASVINNLKRKGYLQAERFGKTCWYILPEPPKEYTGKYYQTFPPAGIPSASGC